MSINFESKGRWTHGFNKNRESFFSLGEWLGDVLDGSAEVVGIRMVFKGDDKVEVLDFWDLADSKDSDSSDFDDVDLIDYWFQSTGLIEGTQYVTDHSVNTYIVPFVSNDWRQDFRRRARGGMYLGGRHNALDNYTKGR